MTTPLVSIIIPAYNNAEYLGEAIQSVLDQTYPFFEVVVVNDGSPDHTSEVVGQFNDSRLKYIIHEENRGLAATRNTGIKESSGEILALLDGDDIFHPEKLQLHVDYLNRHPEVGSTYNARFELNHSAMTIRELWRPPLTVGLADLVFGFPFGPSDMVLRREWAFRVNLFEEYHLWVGEDLDINCRLALAGCKFASVDRALNYRRYHSGRVIKNLRGAVEDTIRPLNSVFSDPACPEEVVALRDQAIANHLMLWSPIAFAQGDTALGQDYCLEAIRLNPSILDGKPGRLLETLISYSIVDESQDHPQILHEMFDQLPVELAWHSVQYDWAVARGYLFRGTRAIMWGRSDDGHKHFEHALVLGAQIDRSFLRSLTSQLLDYEVEFGLEATQNVINELSTYFEKIGGQARVRWLRGHYSINQAFQYYRAGKYAKVPKEVVQACANDPKYLTNIGVWSIFFRSIVGIH